MPKALTLSSLLILIGLTGCVSRDKEEPAQAAAPPAAYPGSDSGSSQGHTGGGQNAPAPSKIQTTYSGLQYEVLREGSGRRPTRFNRVKVHYHGYLPNGKVFDSSVQRGQPVVLSLDRVIPGWREGIPLMKEGAKYRFTIPPNLAYGQQGSPPVIGPNQTLKFDVDLLEVVY